MGIFASYNEVCPICGKEALTSEYNYRTGEHFYACLECGYLDDLSFKCENGKVSYREHMRFRLSDLVIVTRSAYGQNVLAVEPLSLAKTDRVFMFSLFCGNSEGTIKSICEKTDVNTPVFSRCDDFKIEMGNPSEFIVLQPIMQVDVRVPQKDGTAIIIHPIHPDECDRLRVQGADVPTIAEDYYVSANGKEFSLPYNLVEKNGGEYILQHLDELSPN